MSASPPKEKGVEPALQSPDGSEPHMDREAQDAQAQGSGYDIEVKEQDRWLPIANAGVMSSPSPQTSASPPQGSSKGAAASPTVSDANIRNFAPVARIMKMALPQNAKIAKEAKECMQECVSEFISFITSEASEKCQQEKRKTVNGEDILFAMGTLGFENYAEALKIYLSRYRETLLANQKQPSGSSQYGAAGPSGSGSNANAPGTAYGQADTGSHTNVLSDQDMGDNEGVPEAAFGYTVHNGNGQPEY
ncbi:histone-fold-containing protein [Sporormia fimetaria CBS 119925]|uniref:Histone-fold-containing protein n=1 Tax=Sporormia fimetaria CBS 119925 TaxID=1340428 RepID=A0A6A6VM11_9PLEO|nr:histone-fold-containing protein [Sporormia fimetaria CBS 119925]